MKSKISLIIVQILLFLFFFNIKKRPRNDSIDERKKNKKEKMLNKFLMKLHFLLFFSFIIDGILSFSRDSNKRKDEKREQIVFFLFKKTICSFSFSFIFESGERKASLGHQLLIGAHRKGKRKNMSAPRVDEGPREGEPALSS